MLTVVCVKSKPAYDHAYVNRLYRAVERSLTIPHRFVCFTDDAEGIRCATRPLPAGHRKGWYSKLALHRPGLLTPPVLYLDLDTLIVDSLDFVQSYSGEFSILRDFYRPDGYGSGVMIWNKPQPQVWERWVAEGQPEHPLGDQGWMEETVPSASRLQDLYPEKFVSYKVHCQGGLPADAAVVCFHGFPKPHDFPVGHWVEETWTGAGVTA
jgi:hypothetical protein